MQLKWEVTDKYLSSPYIQQERLCDRIEYLLFICLIYKNKMCTLKSYFILVLHVCCGNPDIFWQT